MRLLSFVAPHMVTEPSCRGQSRTTNQALEKVVPIVLVHIGLLRVATIPGLLLKVTTISGLLLGDIAVSFAAMPNQKPSVLELLRTLVATEGVVLAAIVRCPNLDREKRRVE